jgi:hypothetical protein
MRSTTTYVAYVLNNLDSSHQIPSRPRSARLESRNALVPCSSGLQNQGWFPFLLLIDRTKQLKRRQGTTRNEKPGSLLTRAWPPPNYWRQKLRSSTFVSLDLSLSLSLSLSLFHTRRCILCCTLFSLTLLINTGTAFIIILINWIIKLGLIKTRKGFIPANLSQSVSVTIGRYPRIIPLRRVFIGGTCFCPIQFRLFIVWELKFG